MSTRELHCPFLNRADARCATHFSLSHVGEALDHCFGAYGGCPTYQDLLTERRLRRAQQGPRPAVIAHAIPPQFVQLRLPAGHHSHAA